MIAAIYARKSTEQTGADADAKSVARQIENARAFAAARGWTVPDAHVYSDDAISGAETRKLKNRQRLIDAITSGRSPVQVLVLRDASRLSRRDGDEAFGELKRIAQAGVEIWFYQDATRFSHGTFGDNVVGFVRAEMNAEYRREVSRWVKEAMVRKARAGHVTGGACFGYDNVKVDGHTERRINPEHAAVIRRIFALCADGVGYSRIAKLLNADGAPAPKPTRGRPPGWSPSTIHEVLRRPVYRGEVIYNQTRRRDAGGALTFAARPESDWLRFDRPELRIVSPDAWHAARQRLDGIREQLHVASGGKLGGHRRDIDSRYLFSGFMRCTRCGGTIAVMNRSHGHRPVYGCLAHHKRGTTVCDNALVKPLADVDDAVLTTLRVTLRPKAVDEVIDRAWQALAPPTLAADRARCQRDVDTVDRAIANLTTAIEMGDALPPLLDALKRKHAERQTLVATLAAHDAVDVTRLNRQDVARNTRRVLGEWQTRLRGQDVADTRQALREILVGPLAFRADGTAYHFEGDVLLDKVLAGTVGSAPFLARPDARSKGCTLHFTGVAA